MHLPTTCFKFVHRKRIRKTSQGNATVNDCSRPPKIQNRKDLQGIKI